MDHDEQKALLSLHALSSLDREDGQALEIHLSACDECRADLDAWQGTVAALAYVAQPLEPSAQIRDRILARVRAESGGSAAAKVVPISRPQGPANRSVLWFPSEVGAFQAIAASVIFLGLIIGLVAMWLQHRATLAEVNRLSTQVLNMRQQLDLEHTALGFSVRPEMRRSELDGTKEAPSAHATLAVDSTSGQAMLMAKGLPQAPAGKAYQLWFIAGAQPIPGKVFKPDASGNVMLNEQLPAGAIKAAVFAVTLEPQSGVRAPTGAMYLLTPTRPPS